MSLQDFGLDLRPSPNQINSMQAEPGSWRWYRQIEFIDIESGETVTIKVEAPMDLVENAFALVLSRLR